MYNFLIENSRLITTIFQILIGFAALIVLFFTIVDYFTDKIGRIEIGRSLATPADQCANCSYKVYFQIGHYLIGKWENKGRVYSYPKWHICHLSRFF